MEQEATPLRRLSEFAWRTVELEARAAFCPAPGIITDMSEAITNYRTNGFCFFRPYGEREEALRQSLEEAVNACDEVRMDPDNTCDNYRASEQLCDPLFLEDFNRYMSFSRFDQNALDQVEQFLQLHKDLLSAMLGYHFTVLNVRCQISEPGATVSPFSWHTDELPDAIVKILYYLDGASDTAGTTAVKLASGEEIAFEGEVGSWVLININKVLHKGIASVGSRRKMLEITLGPAIIPDCAAYAVALNASYPWVPWLSPGYCRHNVPLAPMVDEHSTCFNKLVAELGGCADSDDDSLKYKAALSVLEYNAINKPKHLNIGGGPGFLHKDWRNFEEIFSVNNPVPFHLSPGIAFPVESDSLETVYSSHNLEHLDDETVAHVLTESFRVLKPGSFLVIKIPDFDQYLDKWIKGDSSLTFEKSPFSFKESRTWRNKGIADTITYRTAEMFCGVWNATFGDENALFSNAGDWNGPGYVGPPWIPEKDIADIFTQGTSCHEMAAMLKQRALALDETVYLNHQNAWSREEMHKLLTDTGFKVLSMDSKPIVENGRYIPGIEQWYYASAYYLAQKPA